MKLVVFGLSLSSSWGNGHATTYRALLRAFAERGHQVTFFEWDAPWYGGEHRDLPDPTFTRLILYSDWSSVRSAALATASDADATMIGSYVRDGAAIIDDMIAARIHPLFFYDIDTPITVAGLRGGSIDYLRVDQVPLFASYLSFTGGPLLDSVVVRELRARSASPLYCSVDTDNYQPVQPDPELMVDLAYMGTYAADRQPVVQRFLLDVARELPNHQFLVAGPLYPADVSWPSNVRHLPHIPPSRHAAFYSSARWQLNATRAEMIAVGWSPSVRLFEAGAVGAPIISDSWTGIETFFQPGQEIILPESTRGVVDVLTRTPEEDRRAIGEAMRRRVHLEHSSIRRAAELEAYLRLLPNPGDDRHRQSPAGSQEAQLAGVLDELG